MNRHAAFIKELTAAIPCAPEPYNVLLARAAIAIAKEQQWHTDAVRERDAMRVKLAAWRSRVPTIQRAPADDSEGGTA